MGRRNSVLGRLAHLQRIQWNRLYVRFAYFANVRACFDNNPGWVPLG